VVALDADSGARRWMVDAAGDGRVEFHADPVLVGAVVVAASDGPTGALFGVDVTSGRLLWRHPRPGGFSVTPVVADARVIALSAAGEVLQVDARTGEARTLARFEDGDEPNTRAHPALASDRLILALPTGVTAAVATATGDIRWSSQIEGTPNTGILVLGEHVVLGTREGAVWRMGTSNGAAAGRWLLPGFVHGTPVAAGGSVLVLHADSITALAPDLSAVRWSRSLGAEISTFRPLVRDDLSVVVGTEDSRLLALAAADGSTRWELAVDGAPRGLAADGPILYVGTLAGAVMALREPVPTPHSVGSEPLGRRPRGGGDGGRSSPPARGGQGMSR
jgi:outer membrane protein assembly factor BamB